MTAAAARPSLTAAPRRPTPARRAARRSAGLALAGLALLLGATAAGAAPHDRYVGQVTDALRNPTHHLAASASSGRAVADLVFSDMQGDHTRARTCVRRRDVANVRTCFTVTTGAAGVAAVTPLRFPPGSYVAGWRVAGALVASWRFTVTAS